MKYQPLDAQSIGAQTVNVSGSEMSVVLMGLQECMNYTIMVRAYTSAGAGPFSDGVTIMINNGEYVGCIHLQ